MSKLTPMSLTVNAKSCFKFPLLPILCFQNQLPWGMKQLNIVNILLDPLQSIWIFKYECSKPPIMGRIAKFTSYIYYIDDKILRMQ